MNNEDQNQPTPPKEPMTSSSSEVTNPEPAITQPSTDSIAPVESEVPVSTPVTAMFEPSVPAGPIAPVSPINDDQPMPPTQSVSSDMSQPGAPVSQHHTDGLGIASIIMAFTGLQLIGFILGLVGSSQAKKKGQSATLSRVGWILNLVIGLVGTLIVVGLVLANFQGAQAKARDTESVTDINSIHAKLEESYNNNGYYPDKISSSTLTGVDPEALKDSKGVSYSYVVSPTGCTQCASYVLSTPIEDSSYKLIYGETYKKRSLNDTVDTQYNQTVPSSKL